MGHPEVPEDAPPPLRRSDIRLIGRAVEGCWPIPDEDRLGILASLVRIAQGLPDGNGPEPSDKLRVAAAKVVLLADAVNLNRRRLELREPTEDAGDYVIDLAPEPDGETHARR